MHEVSEQYLRTAQSVLLQSARNKYLNLHSRRLLCYIITKIDSDGDYGFDKNHICRELSISHKTFENCLRQLEEYGFIEPCSNPSKVIYHVIHDDDNLRAMSG